MDSTALALTIAAFGIVLIALSHQRQMQHRGWSAVGYGSVGTVLFVLGIVQFSVALNINTYVRWQNSQTLAQLSVEQTAPHTFRVNLTRIPFGDLQVFKLNGDNWHVTVQQLNWHGWPQLIGMQENTRLQSLNSDGDEASNYTISRNPGIDLAALAAQHSFVQRILQSWTLTSASVPLQDGLRYHVDITPTGLDIRVLNQPH